MKSESKNVTVFMLIVCSVIGGSCFASAASSTKKKKNSLKSLQQLINGPADKPTTVAGVRGLDEEGAVVDTTLRDYPAAGRMENFKVSDDDLRKFIEEGKLK